MSGYRNPAMDPPTSFSGADRLIPDPEPQEAPEWRHQPVFGRDPTYCDACGTLWPWPCDAEQQRLRAEAAERVADAAVAWRTKLTDDLWWSKLEALGEATDAYIAARGPQRG